MRERTVCHVDTSNSGNLFHKNSEIVELPNGDLFGAWFANPHGGRGEFHWETTSTVAACRAAPTSGRVPGCSSTSSAGGATAGPVSRPG